MEMMFFILGAFQLFKPSLRVFCHPQYHQKRLSDWQEDHTSAIIDDNRPGHGARERKSAATSSESFMTTRWSTFGDQPPMRTPKLRPKADEVNRILSEINKNKSLEEFPGAAKPAGETLQAAAGSARCHLSACWIGKWAIQEDVARWI